MVNEQIKKTTFSILLLLERIEREKNKPLTGWFSLCCTWFSIILLLGVFLHHPWLPVSAKHLYHSLFICLYFYFQYVEVVRGRERTGQMWRSGCTSPQCHRPTWWLGTSFLVSVSTWCKGQMKTLNRTKLTFDIFVSKIQKEAHDLLLKLFLLLIATNVLVNSGAPKLRKSTPSQKIW